MKLSVIIVSFNTKDLLRACLTSFYKNTKKGILSDTEVIVVDNASHDGSKDMVKSEFPIVTLIENEKNLGFAKANNIGVKKSLGEHILFLNSDTIIEEKSIEDSMLTMSKMNNVGVLGCNLKNKDHSLQYSAGYTPNLFNVTLWMLFIDDIPVIKNICHQYHIESKKFYKASHVVGWVSGAFFLVRKKAIEATGLFDENMFMYGEEVELCMRMKKCGWLVYYSKDSSIIHIKGASGEGQIAGIKEEFQALKYMWKKYHPTWQMPVLRIMLRTGALLRYAIFGIISKDKKKQQIYAKAFSMV